MVEEEAVEETSEGGRGVNEDPIILYVMQLCRIEHIWHLKYINLG